MTDVLDLAVEFARAIVNGNSGSAHEMLSHDFRKKATATDLATQFESIEDDMGGVTGIGEPMVILEEWPNMSANDRAMVYVPLEGDVYSEAITVTISEFEDGLSISNIEWGRP